MEPLSATVVQTLRTEIIDGRIAVGDRLTEDALAARFGVSRVPVREALQQLESEGFVIIEKFKGASVSSRSHQDVIELMQVRAGSRCWPPPSPATGRVATTPTTCGRWSTGGGGPATTGRSTSCRR